MDDRAINAVRAFVRKPDKGSLSDEERLSLGKIQLEADQRSSKLRSNGRGGLPPSLVLHVMRRDVYRCKKCGQEGSDANGGLTVHHKAGAPTLVGRALIAKASDRHDPHGLATICHKCHDDVHDADRENK